MSIKWQYENDGIIVFHVSGKLNFKELNKSQLEAETIIQKGKIKLLVFADNFEGWDNSDEWDDLSFMDRNDQFIEKMAIIGDPKWEELISIFTLKGLRKFPIEYFNSGEENQARFWLEEQR